jgi:hypothetical protein
MSAMDPLRTVWDMLERAGCDPHGRPYDFRARCPNHDGEHIEALHVSIGGDGRVLLHCHAHGCSVESICAALGLSLSHLFPAGHHRARRRKLPDAARLDFEGDARIFVNVLAAIEQLGGGRYLELRCDCSHCGAPGAVLQASRGGISFSCPGDADAEALGYTACTLDQFRQALAGRVEDHKKTRAP